jgi:hypothetical protein
MHEVADGGRRQRSIWEISVGSTYSHATASRHRETECENSWLGGPVRTKSQQSRRMKIMAGGLSLGIVLAACCFWFWMRMVRRDIGSPQELTRGHIVDILGLVQGYRDETGNWPDSRNWASILRNSLADPGDRRAFDAKMSDGWGSLLRCEISGSGTNSEFHCISAGPNRVTDDGDDVIGVLKNGIVKVLPEE